MKASYRWLCELVPGLHAPPAEIAERLTGAGLEVEGLTEFGAATRSCVVARVVSMRAHPTKSGLRLVTVDRGGAQQELVCGAPNVPEPGGLVVLAPLGTHLPKKGVTIEKRAIGGVSSEGMLCSEDELGLSDDHAGIIVLPPGTAEPGAIFASVVPNAHDTVLEIGLTPNRPDGLGHVGLARELAALYKLPFGLEPFPASKIRGSVAIGELVSIAVEDPERCPHYGAAAVVGVANGPSPLFVKYRLQALGVRSISAVVDVTNLVMLEYGHPMHAFDLDRVRGGKIVVRRAREGERMTTLDGIERVLVADDLLICDGEGPVALAGVMGGASSEIQANTSRVLFECAYFDPRGVRRTSRRHGLHTESSHRFERGVDPGDVVQALDDAVILTLGLTRVGTATPEATTGRLHVQGALASSEPAATERRRISLRASRIEEVLGVPVPWAEATAILERLGCALEKRTQTDVEVLVPTHRPDLAREIDLVEEVVRVHGFDAVPAQLPAIRASRDVGGREELLRRARDCGVALGLSEAITYSFTSARVLELLSAPRPVVTLKNPLHEHQAVMRTSLLPGLLDAVKNARRHGERDLRAFTLGAVFVPGHAAAAPASGLPVEPASEGWLPEERMELACVLAGDRDAHLTKPQPVDAWDAKGLAEGLVRRLAGVEAEVRPARRDEVPAHLHPRGAAFVHLAGKRVGTLGPLHPDVVEALELDGDVMVVELDLSPFAAGPRSPQYAPIPRYPASTRDIALVVKDGVPAGEVEVVVRSAAGPLAEVVRLFDRFVGGAVPAGFASLAFHVVYRAPDRTLTDAEVDAAHANVVKEVEGRFGATLRA